MSHTRHIDGSLMHTWVGCLLWIALLGHTWLEAIKKPRHNRAKGFMMSRCTMAWNLWLLFPLALILLLSSRHEKVIKWHLFCSKRGIGWKDYHLTKTWQCFHSNNDVFTLRLESDRKKEPQIPLLRITCCAWHLLVLIVSGHILMYFLVSFNHLLSK